MLIETSRLSLLAAALAADLRAAARAARGGGFAGLLCDVRIGALDLTELSQTGRREVRHVLSGDNLRLVGLRMELGNHGLGARADIDREISRLDAAMEAAAGLGSPLVCVDIGPLPAVAEPPKPKIAIDPNLAGSIFIPPTVYAPPVAEQPAAVDPADVAAMAAVDAAMIEIGKRADRYQVMLAWRSELSSAASLYRAITGAGCPWFGVDFDPVSLLRDQDDLDAAFSLWAPWIRHVRARDAVRGTDGRSRPSVIGHGSIDWLAVLEGLEQSAYSGWITIDTLELIQRASAAVEAAGYLTKVGGKLPGTFG